MQEEERFRLFVANRLASVRKAKALTQKEAAIRAGVTPSSWANYEAADRGMKEYTLSKIAKALGTTSSYLLGETDEMDSGTEGYTVLTGGAVRDPQDENLLAFNAAGLKRLGYNENQLLTIVVRDDAILGMAAGDLAVIDTSKTDIETPGLYAIKSPKGHYWLRYVRAEITGGYTLFTDNKSSTPDQFMSNDDAAALQIAGRHIGHFHWANKSR